MLTSQAVEEYKKTLTDNLTINKIIPYAQKLFPNEVCGFIFIDGSIQPANNSIDSLGQVGLNSKNSFLIDAHSWALAKNTKKQIIGIYHSHTSGDANMSSADEKMLDFDGMIYIIVSLRDHNFDAAKLHWWKDKELISEEIK